MIDWNSHIFMKMTSWVFQVRVKRNDKEASCRFTWGQGVATDPSSEWSVKTRRINIYYFLTSMLDVRIYLSSSKEEVFIWQRIFKQKYVKLNVTKSMSWLWYSQDASETICHVFFFLLLLKAMCNYVLILIISCLTLQMEDMGKNQQPGREQGQRSVEPSQDKGGVDTTTSWTEVQQPRLPRFLA